jgi:hypothetical protein
MKLNSMLGLIRKPGRTIGFPFLSVFKRLVPRDRRIIAISALAKQTQKGRVLLLQEWALPQL